MLVGDLVVRMAADIADLRAGFNEAKDTMAKFADQADRAIGQVKTALVSMATAYSFAESIRQTVEYGSQLQRLQDITGLAAAEVQQLSLVAKLNDTDAGALTKSWGKLVTQLVDVGTEGETTRAIIKALGVDAFDPLTGKVKPANDLIGQMAAQFNAIRDPAEKAKLASELFGKTYQDMLVIFKNWNDDGERARELFAKIGPATDEATQKADAFGDSLTMLAETSKAKLLPHLGSLADLLERVRGLMLQSSGESSTFGKVLDYIGSEVLPAVVETLGSLGIAFLSLFASLGKFLAGVAAAATAIASGDGLAAAWDVYKQANEDANEVIRQSNVDIANLMDRTKGLKTATLEEQLAQIDATAALQDNATAALRAGEAKKKEEEARKKAAEAARKEAEELDKLTAKYQQMLVADQAGLATNTIQQLTELARLLDTGRIRWDEYNRLVGDVLDKDPILAAEQKEINKNLDEMAKLLDQVREAHAKELSAIDDQIAAQVRANATFGLGKTAVIDYTIAELQRQQANAAGIPGEETAIDQLQRRIEKLWLLRDAVSIGEALEAQRKDLETSAKAWDAFIADVGKAFGNFLDDWVNNGATTAFKNLWQNFTKWALQAIAEVAAKQIVVSIGASIGLTGGALAGGLPGTGGGGTGFLGDIGSGLGSLLTGSMSLGTAFENLGTILPTFTSVLADTGSVASALTSAFSGMGASIGAVVPVVGAVVAAGTMIYNWIASKGGGPKEGGWATTGETPGIGGTDGSGRWFTPSGSDPEMVKAVQGIQAQYQAILAALGGSGNAVFAQGFSTDPNGTAPSNVHTGAWVNGTQIFDNPNGNVGRSAEELKAELQAQSMRAILAALQASELPTVVHDYLASIDVSTASVAEIEAALKRAAELKVLVDQVSKLPEAMADGLIAALGASPELDAQIKAFATNFTEFSAAASKLSDQLARNPMSEATEQVRAASETTYEKVGRLRGALQDSLGAYDGSAAGTDKLTAATKAYIDAQVAALAQIEQIKASLNTMFGDTQRTFDLAVMDSKQRETYFATEAEKTVALLKNTTDPAKIAELSRIVNSDLTSALGLIDPVKQREEYNRLQGILNDAQTTATTQLGIAKDSVTQANVSGETILGNVKTSLDAASAKQQQAANDLIAAAQAIRDAATSINGAATTTATAASTTATAANTMNTAASTIQTAAQTPVQVVVTYNDGAGP